MIQNEKAYYLKNLELALLLSAKGMTELYGIKMDDVHMPDKNSVYQTLFELEKKKLITFHDHKIVICPEVDEMLDDIRNAQEMLLYRNKTTEYPDQCIYLGKKAVFISAYGREQGMNRIESIFMNSLPEKIQECGFRLEEMISDGSLFEESEIENADLAEQAKHLFDQGINQPENDGCENISNCLKVISLNSKKCIRQYLIINEMFNDYFVRTDEQTSCVFAYSGEKVLRVLKADLLETDQSR